MKKVFLIILGFFIFLALFLAAVFFYIYHQIKTPVAMAGQDQQIIIEKGLSIKQIAGKLEDVGLIRDAFYFKTYIYLEGINNLQAGEYVLNPVMSIPEIATALSGGLVDKNEARITIPEGFTVKQIDERLAAAGLIRPGEISNYRFPVPNSHFPVPGPEGYLFPDTYIFDKKTTVEKIVQKMIDNFDKKVTPEMRDEAQRQGRTLNNVIIMASIVQQEASSTEEMPRIAGVFYNRLVVNMSLQSDATVNYITGKGIRQASIDDTKIDSPYNTYKYKGLPPGPICNPGLDAIKAAIWPEKNDYYYFLHPLSAPTVFSRTEEDHRANKAKWLK